MKRRDFGKGLEGLALCACLLLSSLGTVWAGQEEEALTGAAGAQAPGQAGVEEEPLEEGAEEEVEEVLHQPGFFYTPKESFKLEGEALKAIACEGGSLWTLQGQGLFSYDEGCQRLAANPDPLEGLGLMEGASLADIDVYDGQVYALVEASGEEELGLAIYDGESLERTSFVELSEVPWEGALEGRGGLSVDRDYHLIWVSLGGEELYRLDETSFACTGITRLLDSPGELGSPCAYDGYLYFLSREEGFLMGEGLYRYRVDLSREEGALTYELALESGERAAMGVDRKKRELLVGEDELFLYTMERNQYPLDYSLSENWVLRPEEGEEAIESTDVFFVLPTVNMKNFLVDNEDITNLRAASRYGKTLNMEKGIFEGTARIFAPYYRQMTFGAFQPGVDTSSYERVAYGDVERAFDWFLENHGKGRPFFLFGYSQGAYMLRALLEERGEEEVFKDMVAAYLIGADLTLEDLQAYPQLEMAKSETDTGVIISYECMDEMGAVDNGVHRASINPLNWATDSTPAGEEENLGMTLVDASGAVVQKQEGFCGAYLDEATGYLIPTGIESPENWYSVGSPIFPDGSYHVYDIFFFYENLKENIRARAQAFGG